ncbi:MAG: TatD family hydrolase [Bacilli bacterium]|nr:TatD family hydrolase [Bacilli bacterium]
MYIDTHCHLSRDDYEDIEKIIENAINNKVEYMIVSGCDKKSIKESIAIAENHNNIFLAIGYHPSEVLTTTDEDLIELEKIAKSNKKVVAIGEIGLDYHWDKENKDNQKELFKKQIAIAKRLKLPIVIHSRDAFQDTYDILKEFNHYGVIHCFSGNIENAKMYSDLGFYFGIGGVLTFKNTNLRETVKTISKDRLILETDSPYLAPTPHRGEKNEPMYIPLIADCLSKSIALPVNEIEKITTENAVKLFNLNISKN